jgi:hypothetical protein
LACELFHQVVCSEKNSALAILCYGSDVFDEVRGASHFFQHLLKRLYFHRNVSDFSPENFGDLDARSRSNPSTFQVEVFGTLSFVVSAVPALLPTLRGAAQTKRLVEPGRLVYADSAHCVSR